MMALNVAAPFGNSLEKAAAEVKARVLVIVNRQDHTVTPGPAIEFARLLHADLVELDDACGHQYNACDDERVRLWPSSCAAKSCPSPRLAELPPHAGVYAFRKGGRGRRRLCDEESFLCWA